MGFWETVGAAGVAAYKGLEAKGEKIRNYKEQFERYDDERLLRMSKSSSGDRRIAVLMLLKERGYTVSDIKENY